MNKKHAILISNEGILYRGIDICNPSEVWDYPRKKWVTYHGGTKPIGWGQELEESAAEQLKSNNPDAEHFLYFDTPPWAQPLSESYKKKAVPDFIRADAEDSNRDECGGEDLVG